MEYLCIALAVIIAAGGITAAIAFPTMTHERDTARADLDAARLELSQAKARSVALTDLAAVDARKFEAVVAGLKAEIARLNGELDACRDPAVTAARLDGLFPAEPAAAGQPAVVRLPA